MWSSNGNISLLICLGETKPGVVVFGGEGPRSARSGDRRDRLCQRTFWKAVGGVVTFRVSRRIARKRWTILLLRRGCLLMQQQGRRSGTLPGSLARQKRYKGTSRFSHKSNGDVPSRAPGGPQRAFGSSKTLGWRPGHSSNCHASVPEDWSSSFPLAGGIHSSIIGRT